MTLHDWFGRHAADLDDGHWDRGRFVSHCTKCGRAMIKLPGLPWQLRGAAHCAMAKIRPSATKALNYVLTTFLVALPAMVMVYKWGMAR